MLKALEKSLGVVTTACNKVNVARATHYSWMAKDKKYKKAVEDISEMGLDFAESQLFSLIQDRHPASVFFYLKCKGKGRGYIEKADYENNDNDKEIKLVFVGEKSK